jgi:hypothetical protein
MLGISGFQLPRPENHPFKALMRVSGSLFFRRTGYQKVDTSQHPPRPNRLENRFDVQCAGY